MTKIAIITGSSRTGRVTDRVSKWVANNAKQFADATILDLQDYPIPFLDEAVSPRFNPNRTPDEATAKWLKDLADYDAYVIVTPEYNRSMPGVLKNAVDVIGHELDDKPVALIGHGSTGGAQAVATLRLALPGIGAVALPQAVFLTQPVADIIDEDGNLSDELKKQTFGPETNLEMQLQTLVRYAKALKNL
ncbi:NAD(P)H-dependent oxidoreductase [Candidatus Saccharibacteria bacterium]|nr:NAD(P)H-dependent oxidoreductase [Candidatus Saccharibacteria bacterium]